MGIIAMAMVTTGYATEFQVPWWVITLSASAIALGTLTGGWRLIKTLGGKFYKIRPVHAFGSQLTSAGIILGAALLGGPVSTTQVVSSSIMGAGSADRVSKVRWTVARDIAVAWLLTIPVSALLAAGLYLLVDLLSVEGANHGTERVLQATPGQVPAIADPARPRSRWQGMDALEAYMKKRSDKHAAAVVQAEKDADEVRRILIDDLNRTFVTPMDREDIFALSRAIDDVMDYAYTTVEEMQILDVEPNDYPAADGIAAPGCCRRDSTWPCCA